MADNLGRGRRYVSCECGDTGCPVHAGEEFCGRRATQTLYRIDIEDATGTAMCDKCAEDAFASGWFVGDENESIISEDALGTQWVAPGKGNTLGELVAAMEKVAIDATGKNEYYTYKKVQMSKKRLNARIAKRASSETNIDRKTNLALTGRPLQDYDLERISVVGLGEMGESVNRSKVEILKHDPTPSPAKLKSFAGKYKRVAGMRNEAVEPRPAPRDLEDAEAFFWRPGSEESDAEQELGEEGLKALEWLKHNYAEMYNLEGPITSSRVVAAELGKDANL